MAYKNDSYLVIMNRFGNASSDAKSQLFETYDRLRDITVSGQATNGGGFGTVGNFLWQIATLMSPSSFMPTLGGMTIMDIPGTSYWSPVSGGTAQRDGGNSAFGIGGLGNYPGFPGGAAPVSWGWGSSSYNGGVATGGASGIASASSIAGMTGINAAAYAAGTATGFGWGQNVLLPLAGLVAGWGGILEAAAPYMGEYGLGAMLVGNLLQGTSSAGLSAYQNITGTIQNNADVILSNKVKNIETVCKMLDTQSDVVKKMLKESLEGDSKAIQDL